MACLCLGLCRWAEEGQSYSLGFHRSTPPFEELVSCNHFAFFLTSFQTADSGLVVPSISYELHKKLLAVAEKHGLTLERRLEMTGVCASQMALTLLGGPNR